MECLLRSGKGGRPHRGLEELIGTYNFPLKKNKTSKKKGRKGNGKSKIREISAWKKKSTAHCRGTQCCVLGAETLRRNMLYKSLKVYGAPG